MSRRLPVLWLLAPLAGCWFPFPPCGSGDCPKAEPVKETVYTVTDGEPAEVVGGEVEVVGDDVVIWYEDDFGNVWEVHYAVTDRFPR